MHNATVHALFVLYAWLVGSNRSQEHWIICSEIKRKVLPVVTCWAFMDSTVEIFLLQSNGEGNVSTIWEYDAPKPLGSIIIRHGVVVLCGDHTHIYTHTHITLAPRPLMIWLNQHLNYHITTHLTSKHPSISYFTFSHNLSIYKTLELLILNAGRYNNYPRDNVICKQRF